MTGKHPEQNFERSLLIPPNFLRFLVARILFRVTHRGALIPWIHFGGSEIERNSENLIGTIWPCGSPDQNFEAFISHSTELSPVSGGQKPVQGDP